MSAGRVGRPDGAQQRGDEERAPWRLCKSKRCIDCGETSRLAECFPCGVCASEPMCDACAERCNTICNTRANYGGITDKATKGSRQKALGKHKELSAKKGKTYREVFGVSSESSPEKLTRENGTQLDEERSECSGTDKTIKDNRVADDQGDVDNRSQPTPQPVGQCTVDCDGSTPPVC